MPTKGVRRYQPQEPIPPTLEEAWKLLKKKGGVLHMSVEKGVVALPRDGKPIQIVKPSKP